MKSERRKIGVIGASRGIGAAVAQHFAQKGDLVVSISRSQAVAGEWIQADISTSDGIKSVADAIGDSVLDALLFMGGLWDDEAFTPLVQPIFCTLNCHGQSFRKSQLLKKPGWTTMAKSDFRVFGH